MGVTYVRTNLLRAGRPLMCRRLGSNAQSASSRACVVVCKGVGQNIHLLIVMYQVSQYGRQRQRDCVEEIRASAESTRPINSTGIYAGFCSHIISLPECRPRSRDMLQSLWGKSLPQEKQADVIPGTRVSCGIWQGSTSLAGRFVDGCLLRV